MSTLLETLPPARPAELHAISIAKNIAGEHVLATTVGRGQAAITLAETRPEAKVSLWFHDQYQQQLLVKALQELPTQLSLYCEPDPPPSSSGGQYDLAILPVFKSGEAEFTRDVLQSAFQSLSIGGHLVAAIDNPNDKWLRSQLADTGETVRVRPDSAEKPTTVCYILRKTRPSKKVRDFTSKIVFRDRERLLTAITRPGVFAHRRIDPAARHLLNAVDLASGARVLEIGCGSGCVSLGLAARDSSIEVYAIDSSARAVSCLQQSAAENELPNITVLLEAHGVVPDPGCYDLVLANPPYYSDFRIAEMFVEAARTALAPGGTLLLVTKQPVWYLEQLPQNWNDVAQELVKGYHLIEAVRP
ncbi:MAG: methyltransferase [Planctomycetaceae bacterium]|nr:methyltransferase [Planctomycetaceae bacterium]